jgi:hypothetical protein
MTIGKERGSSSATSSGISGSTTWRCGTALVLCYSQQIPVLGPTLSRLREYSCDRNGAALESKGELGLVLLSAGRYAADNVQASELVDQGRDLGGSWVRISHLPRSHPWTVRRIWRLHRLGLFGPAHTVDQAHRSQPVA